MRHKVIFLVLVIIVSIVYPLEAASYLDPVVNIGDITRIKGIRDNQLIGNGIVIGLAGSGDSRRSQATVQMVANMLENFGLDIDADEIQSGNLAAVIVTAKLPAFTHAGDTIDVTINSLGDADSLQGGTLLMTPLRAATGDVYAVAQGPVSIGGFNVQAGGGNRIRQNHPTVGRIPNGAIVERELPIELDNSQLSFLLDTPNFETADFIAKAINSNFKYLYGSMPVADAVDAGQIQVQVPAKYKNKLVSFITAINNLQVRSSMEAKVVINERTGTIVMGHKVRISTVSVAHGNLTVTVSTNEEVSQPNPFSQGETTVTTDTDIQVEKEGGHLVVLPAQGTVQDLVTSLNTIGASPRDIIAILQEIKAAGALHAELELM